MQIGNIHPYWRLRNHPLYPQACAHCNVEPQPSDFGPSHSSQAPPSGTPAQPAEQPEVVEVAGLRLAIDDVQAVRVPSTEALRTRTLSNAFHLLQSKVNTAWKFKLAMATMTALQEALEAPSGGTPAAETSPRGSTQGAQGRVSPTVLPPAGRNATTRAEDAEAMRVCHARMGGSGARAPGLRPPASNARAPVRAQGPRRCQVCVSWGEPDSVSTLHRGKSSNCPYVNVEKSTCSIPIRVRFKHAPGNDAALSPILTPPGGYITMPAEAWKVQPPPQGVFRMPQDVGDVAMAHYVAVFPLLKMFKPGAIPRSYRHADTDYSNTYWDSEGNRH